MHILPILCLCRFSKEKEVPSVRLPSKINKYKMLSSHYRGHQGHSKEANGSKIRNLGIKNQYDLALFTITRSLLLLCTKYILCHQDLWEASAISNNYFYYEQLIISLSLVQSQACSDQSPLANIMYTNSTVIKGFHAFDVLSVHIHSMVKWKSLFKSKIFLFQNFTFCF